MKLFQSTSPVWRTTFRWKLRRCSSCISIHVPRVEDDLKDAKAKYAEIYFNPRPPCGGRLLYEVIQPVKVEFQSTSPVWRTTDRIFANKHGVSISIHVPRVEDDDIHRFRNSGKPISIHVPRVEDDLLR